MGIEGALAGVSGLPFDLITWPYRGCCRGCAARSLPKRLARGLLFVDRPTNGWHVEY